MNIATAKINTDEGRTLNSETTPTSANVDRTFGLANHELGFLIARVGLGVNLFFHGVVRMPSLGGFVKGMETEFAESLLPMFMVTPMAYVIPITELVIGLNLGHARSNIEQK